MQNGTYPTAEQIIAASQGSLAHEDVDVEEWGLRVPVVELTGTELAEYRGLITQMRQQIRRARDQKGEPEIAIDVDFHMERAIVRLCYLAMKNPHTGTRIFGQESQVGGLSARGLQKVYRVAARLSGLEEAEEEEAGKGSSATESGDSPGASPEATGSPPSGSSSPD